MSINLLDLIGTEITITSGARKLTIKGETENYTVYKIPLELLFYNDRNGRIATWISQHTSDVGPLDPTQDMKKYNEILHEFIRKSNPGALTKTKNNIKAFGQRVAGVVLQDGRIIDGNRRFTCLRELKYEEGMDCYFEAVILDTTNSITSKDIKRLELNLQHAEEKPVDYNPIDNLVDVYRDIIEEETFTEAEYANNTSRTRAEVSKLIEKSKLMVEFLEFINAKGKYYIARELNLDGPLQEIMLILNKVPEGAEADAIKDTLFTNLLTSKQGDLTRHIRDIGNHIIKTDNVAQFIEDHEEIVGEIYEKLREDKQGSVVQIKEAIQEEKAVVKQSQGLVDDYIEKNKLNNARNKPVELLTRAFTTLDSIDSVAVSKMSDENKKEFKKLLDKMNSTLGLLESKM
ncbi:ParB/RepB/Spo0J family partition protein [Bacillus sp. GB_SG_008]|uniref:ParB/RepB/Spo0J family partition protein n=1 Tax=Bacillus sp. GB_SG_008 TaxID=3454627 RepID=UPI003F856A9D